MKKNKADVLIFVIFCLLFIFALFFRNSIAVIVEDLTAEFSMPAAYLGLMSSTFFYAYAAMQMPVGVLCDRIGVRRTVLYFGLLGGAGSLLFASATGVQTATWGRLLTGMGTAGVWIPALKYLSLNYPPHIFATLSSIISAAGSFGLVLGTLPLALLVEAKGWRFPFFSASLIMALLVGIAWLLMKPSSEQPVNNHNSGLKEPEGTNRNKTASDNPAASPFWKSPVFWYFALWAFLFYGVLFSFTGLWGASFLQETFQISRELASTHLLFSSIGVLIGSLAWAIVSDRLLQARRPLVITGTCSFIALWIIILNLKSYPGELLTSMLYFSLGFFGMTFILMFSCTKEYFPLQTAGAAMGTVNAFMLGGVAVFQGITGYLLDIFQPGISIFTGYRAVFFFYLAALAVTLVLSVLMPETFPGKTKAPSSSGNIGTGSSSDENGIN